MESEYKELVNQRDPFDILRHYLNIKDDEYNRIIMDLFFRGAVAKSCLTLLLSLTLYWT